MSEQNTQKDEEIDELDHSDYGDAEEYDVDPNDPNGFRIRDPLDVPQAKVYTTYELHKMVHEGFIDLSPPYQRDVVWGEAKQIALIDSIFRNFYIPPILFLVSKPDDEDWDRNEELRVCMDGKQRLTSIQKFFDGQIPHKDPVTKKKYWFTSSQSANRLEIPEHFKRIFKEKNITCVEYKDLTPGTERDIFQRVQLGVSLTAAEKLKAVPSIWADWIIELDTKHISNDDGLATLIQWDTKRARNFQCLAQLIYCYDKLPTRTEPTVAKLEQWFVRADGPSQELKAAIEKVLVAYWTIASANRLNAAFKQVKKRVAPVEFVYIGVLLAVLEDCDIDHKAKEVHNLRKYVRQIHKDVRANTRVVKTLWDYIETAQANTLQLVGNGPSSTLGTPGKKRRKRGSDDDDDDGEYRPPHIRTLGSAPSTRARGQK
ncbi:hypothetical protein BD410DRAFT_895640 [Rickenella mellea]|uniref:GmrSD restriction endonucleases N-terminal domain-containing protein n=1 Tax=Rickenella mellea TaxID=50990 RepID=A0A4Y7QHC2_9AGAM|nr:hypothetical protein BD410DRAFT_895640 [Rickenella mellea]